jgi:hypothetical protein
MHLRIQFSESGGRSIRRWVRVLVFFGAIAPGIYFKSTGVVIVL